MSEDDRVKGTDFVIGPAGAGRCAGCFRAVLSFKIKTPRDSGRART